MTLAARLGMRLLLASVLAITACAGTDPAADTAGEGGGGKADSATEARVLERARDLGVELGLAVDTARDNLDIELEDSSVNYSSASTSYTRIATLYWVKITMDTGMSHDFVRAAIVDAPRLGTLDAVVVQPENSPAPLEQRSLDEVDSYARDLGVDLTLAVDQTRQNLDVTYERRLAHYQSWGTANTRVATAHFVNVAMDTGESFDFARFIVIDSSRLPGLVSIPVQYALQ